MPAQELLSQCAGVAAPNSTQGFVQTYGCGVCCGRYAGALVKEWRAWDIRNGSENDPVDAFGDDQLFIVFVVANGGADLEHFEVHSFEEARSIILQVFLFPSCCCGPSLANVDALYSRTASTSWSAAVGLRRH